MIIISLIMQNLCKGGCADISDKCLKSNEYSKSTTVINRKKELKNKKQLIISKTIQTVKSCTKNLKCDDVQLKILNLANALRSRSRKSTLNTAIVKNLDTIEDSTGDDRNLFRTTWAECLNLYQLTCSGSPLKKDDKDNYLPSKFFGSQIFKYRSSAACTFYKFFINRMIASCFQRISCKQELHDNALDVLMMCITSVDKLAEKMLHDNASNVLMNCTILSPSSIILPGKALFKIYAQFSKQRTDICTAFFNNIIDGVCNEYAILDNFDAPDLLVHFYKEIKDKVMQSEMKSGWFVNYIETKKKEMYDEDAVYSLIIQELEWLRKDILEALYNSVCRNRKIMTEKRMKIIQDYLKSNKTQIENECEERFQEKLFDIMDIVTKAGTGLDYKTLLNTYLDVLLSNSSLKTSMSAVDFLIRETRDSEICKEFITNDVLDKLLDLVGQNSSRNELKACIIEVVNNYLEHEFCQDGLNEKHIDILIAKILKGYEFFILISEIAFLLA